MEFETCVKANHEHNDGGQINSDSERDEQTTNRPMVIDHDVDGDHRDDEGACFLSLNFLIGNCSLLKNLLVNLFQTRIADLNILFLDFLI